ncbi:MAG TPA: hypothetical protein VEC13_02515 [Candidatus Paceibacterota bacterium]|nr:hypothetical protein [Candidatus Paceibacterota bacterium]
MSPEDVKRQMQEHYAEFLTTDLLTSWQNNPSLALGRSVSSPWPDKIDVVEVTKVSDDTYKAEGNVIEVANTNSQIQPVAVYPVTLLYRMENGEWKIFGLQKGAYSELPKRITVTGLWECLPHKDTTGPQTEECALGIAVDQSDAHYALDLNLMSATPIDFATGTHIRVQGVMTPANQLNTNIWQKYPIDGIISATSIEKL